MEHVKRINRELVHKGTVLEFYRDDIETPDGRVVHWDFIKHRGAAAVVAVKENGNLLMVRQYRNALDRETIEIPAGCRDSAEEPTIECARRELEEETGYGARNVEFLISLRTAIGYCDEMVDVYLATDLYESKQNLDPDEYVEIVEYSLQELCGMIYAGTIQDAKTIAAVLAYQLKCRNDA